MFFKIVSTMLLFACCRLTAMQRTVSWDDKINCPGKEKYLLLKSLRDFLEAYDADASKSAKLYIIETKDICEILQNNSMFKKYRERVSSLAITLEASEIFNIVLWPALEQLMIIPTDSSIPLVLPATLKELWLPRKLFPEIPTWAIRNGLVVNLFRTEIDYLLSR